VLWRWQEEEFLFACEHALLAMIRALIRLGVNTNARKPADKNRTAIHLAIARMHVDVVTLLCVGGKANPNLQDDGGIYPIHTAVTICDSRDMIDALVRAGADVNVLDHNGFSPLMLAAEHNHLNTIELLLTVPGIDITAVSPILQKTALVVATQCGNIDAATMVCVAWATHRCIALVRAMTMGFCCGPRRLAQRLEHGHVLPWLHPQLKERCEHWVAFVVWHHTSDSRDYVQ
jgi:ankyrin repeat protein